jgi:hypothetical protein
MPVRFGTVPPEVPRIYTLDDLNPSFRADVEAILAEISHERVFETLRTDERQAFLYGFGRLYDDGRGPVTKAATARDGWHMYGLAVDIVENDATPWVAPMAFWQSLGLAAEKRGCVWGGRWKRVDLPHVQKGGIPKSPGPRQWDAYLRGGLPQVWADLGIAA